MMAASNGKPRISHTAIVELGKYLDTKSPTNQDWRVLASDFGFPDIWIRNIECNCPQTDKSPTAHVLRAWQQGISIEEDLPVEFLTERLRRMGRIDAESCVQIMMKEGSFLKENCGHNSASGFSRCAPPSIHLCCCTCQTGQLTSQTNGRSSRKSAQQNSYHGPSQSFLPYGHPETCISCERRPCPCEHQLTSQTYYQPRQPQNGQSVVSLSSVDSDKSENLPLSSQRNNTMTWPLKKGDDMKTSGHDKHLSPSHVSNRRETRHQRHPMEIEQLFHQESNYHSPAQDDDSLESIQFGSLHSTTSVNRMMIERPMQASPTTLKREPMFITYAYKNYKTANKLALLLIDKGHDVKVDNKAAKEGPKEMYPKFTSVTYVIIIYTQDYVNEVTGNVQSKLNTCFIYGQMVKEFKRLGNKNLRFVPIFDHDRIDHNSIPYLLKDYPKQPGHYICKILETSLNTPRPPQKEVSVQRKVY